MGLSLNFLKRIPSDLLGDVENVFKPSAPSSPPPQANIGAVLPHLIPQQQTIVTPSSTAPIMVQPPPQPQQSNSIFGDIENDVIKPAIRILPGGAALQALGQPIGQVVQKEGQQIQSATKNVPVLKTVGKLVGGQVSGYGRTASDVGQLSNTQNPYHGSAPQVAGQVLGDVANVASALPIGEVAGAAKAGLEGADEFAPQLLKSAATNYGYGLAYGTSSGLQQKGATPLSVAESAGQSSLLNAAIGTAVPLIGKGLGSFRRVDGNIAQPNTLEQVRALPTEEEAAKAASVASVEPQQPAEVPTETAPVASHINTSEEVAANLQKSTTTNEVAPVSTPNAPLQIPDALPDKVAKASQEISDAYDHVQGDASDIEGLRRGANATSAEFYRAGNHFEKAMDEEYAPEEQQAVRDNLEGAAKSEEVTPKVQAATDVARQLNEKGANVLDNTHKTSFARLQNYATRLYKSGLDATTGAGARVKKTFQQFLNQKSGFGLHRNVGKFVSSDGEIRYGTQTSAGLKKVNGALVDNTGKHFAPSSSFVPTRELKEQGGIDYEDKYGKIGNAYHSSVGTSKGRFDALQQVLTNPEKFGVSAEQGDGMVEIHDTGGAATDNMGLDGLYTKSSNLKKLQEVFSQHNDPGSLLQQGLDKVNRGVSNLIMLVANVHIINQAVEGVIASGKLTVKIGGKSIQSGPLGLARSIGMLTRYITDSDFRDSMTTDYLHDKGVLANYGAKQDTLITKGLDGVHLPHFNKITSGTMEAADNAFRVSVYAAGKAMNNDGEQVARDIAHFMGDEKAVNSSLRYTTIFFNYLKTITRSGISVANVKDNYGATANFALAGATYLGLQKAWQDWTGNKHATLHAGGVLGLVKEIAEAPGQIKSGEVPSIVSGHVNPVLAATANQTFGKDLRTGQPVGQGTNNGGISRGADLAQTLISPTQYTTRMAQGKATGAQEAVQLLTGSTLPHVKGAPAAPNLPGSILNTKGAKNAQGIDATGEDQAKTYYNGLTALKNQFKNDQSSYDELMKYVDKSHDPATGETIENSPSESQQNALALATNDTLRNAVQKWEQSQAGHDPIWDLSASQLKTLEQYKGMFTGDADKANILQNNPWIQNTITAENNFYNSLPSSKAEANSQTPTYPIFDPATTTLLATYDAADTNGRSVLLQNYGEQLSSAFNSIASWTNAMRKAEGAPPLAGYPEASPQVQAIMATYDALPKGNGPNGGSPDRDAWINANPQAYAQMQAYLTQSSIYSLISNASKAQFAGAQPDQQLLKDIKNVGQYDIATTPGTGAQTGTTQYQLNPALAYTQSSSGSGSSGSSSSNNYVADVIANEKKNTQLREARNAGKALKYAAPKDRNKTYAVHFKGPAGPKAYSIKHPTIGAKIKVSQVKLASSSKKGKISLKSTV